MSGWVKLENVMPEKANVEALSDRAFRLWIHAICACSRGTSDGFLTTAKAARLMAGGTKRALGELISAGLVSVNGEGFEVVDYLKFNPSKAEIAEKRARGAQASRRWRSRVMDDVTDHAGLVTNVSPSHARALRVPVRSVVVVEGSYPAKRSGDKEEVDSDASA